VRDFESESGGGNLNPKVVGKLHPMLISDLGGGDRSHWSAPLSVVFVGHYRYRCHLCGVV